MVYLGAIALQFSVSGCRVDHNKTINLLISAGSRIRSFEIMGIN